MIINLKNVVNNSSSNAEGLKLFGLLDDSVKKSEKIIIEIDKDSSLSSSFLNSSVGLFMEKYGVETFKNKIKIKGSRSQFDRIVSYLDKFSTIAHA